jgi:hypothetical protein
MKAKGPLDLTDSIIAYEQGDLSEEETIDLFQGLIDSGLAWHRGPMGVLQLA